MNRLALVLCLVLVVVAVCGCYKHTYTVGSGAPEGAVKYKAWHSHWFFGIIGETNVELNQLCPSGNATIHEETSFLNGLVRLLIGIIYAPTTVEVRCADGSMGKIELTEEEVIRVVTNPQFRLWVADVTPEHLEAVILAQRSLRQQTTDVAANEFATCEVTR